MSNEILYFFGWWQFAVCLFAFLGLIAIWYHIGRKQNDRGQVWLALSILCWSISGGLDVYYSYQDGAFWSQLEGWHSVLSLANSLFILLALPWFRHLPKSLRGVIHSKSWILIVGLPFLFCLLPTLTRIYSPNESSWISELDVYYSILTLIVLGMVLWQSFVKRRLKSLAYLSVVCILITFFAQIYKLSDDAVNLFLLSGVFKTSLIMIFFALALSWVKDLITKVEINSADIHLGVNVKKENGKILRLAHIEGVGSTPKSIVLTPKNYELLYTFLFSKRNQNEWLEIKPRGEKRASRPYAIHDHNELKRLLISILDQIFGKDSWTKTEHFDPLKEALFEVDSQNSRKIRLKLHSRQISIENTGAPVV